MSRTQREILVTGATGTQGSAVVRQLLKRGYRVRALCRRPDAPAARGLADKGVRIVRGDLEDRASLDAAVDGVYGVFGVQDYWDGFPGRKLGPEGEERQGKNLLDAAGAAGVAHFVQSSGAGVTVAPEIAVNRGKLAVEAHGRSLKLPLTILRGVFFMENFDNPQWGFRDALCQGRLDLPLDDDSMLQLLSADDLAHFVAMAFDRPEDFVGVRVDIAGDQMRMVDIAGTFTRVTGRPVRFTGSSAKLAELRSFDEDLASLFTSVYTHGFQAFIPGLRVLHPEMLTLEAYLHRTGWTAPRPA